MSVLETFIYDPLVEWSSKSKTVSSDGVDNRQAVATVASIEKRLRGQEKAGLPISIKGQVDQQIKEAMSLNNLSQVCLGRSLCFSLTLSLDVYRLGTVVVATKSSAYLF